MSFLLNSFRYVSAASGPAFHALTPDTANDYTMEGVLIGTGDLTTTHTSTLYAPDKDGIYQQFPANAKVWSGGRCVLSGSPEAGSDVSSVHGNESSGGAPLAEVPYLQYYPAAENKAPYSNDLTNWTAQVTPVVTALDQIGLTGEPNTATLVTDADAGVISAVRILYTHANGVSNTVKIWIKKDTDQTRFPRIVTSSPSTFVFFNTETGASRIATGSATIEVADDGDWWILMVEWTTNNTNAYIEISPAGNSNFVGGGNAAATGSVIIGNVESHSGKTIAEVRGLGPIFTTTAAVATDATVYSLDASNHDNTNGGYYAEVMPTASTTESPVEFSGDFELLSLNDAADLLYYDATNAQIESADGTNTAAKSFATVTDTMFQVGLAYGSSNMRINVDGTWGTAASYDGAYPSSSPQALDVLRAAGYAAGIRDLRRYDETYADVQTTIDGLMP